MSEEGLEFMETIRGNYRRREVATDWAMFLRDRIVSRRRGCCMSDATAIAPNHPDGSLKLPSRLRAQMQI